MLLGHIICGEGGIIFYTLLFISEESMSQYAGVP